MQRASTSSLSVMISLQMKHSIMLTIFFFCWCYRALEICSVTCCPLSPTACSSPSSLFSRSASLNIQVSIYCSYALAWIILSWFSFFCWLVPPPNLSGLYCVCLSTAMDNGRSYSCICTHIYLGHTAQKLTLNSLCLFAPSLPAVVLLAYKWSAVGQLCLVSVWAKKNLLDLKGSRSSSYLMLSLAVLMLSAPASFACSPYCVMLPLLISLSITASPNRPLHLIDQ